MLWYGPLFGKKWLGFVRGHREDTKMTGGTVAASILPALVASYVLALIIGNLGITDVWGGISAASAVSIGVGAPTSVNATLYSEVHKGVWYLNAMYHLVLFIGAGVLYPAWPSL